MRKILAALDDAITRWLLASQHQVPTRWAKFLASSYPDARVRRLYLRTLKVEMGDDSFANPGFTVVVDPRATEAQVRIGARVSIGPNVVVVCDSRPNNSPMLCGIPYVRDRLVRNAPVQIDDDAWLGAGAIVLPGVRIGKGAIVGAGSVVLADVPPYHVVAGVPARILRALDPSATLVIHTLLTGSTMSETRVLSEVRAPFTDGRGEILNLLDEPIGSVSRIVSAAGAVRADHYHKTDSHFCFLESGEVQYYHRPMGSTEVPEHFTIGVGVLFYTPPMYEHTMVFTERSVMWCFAKNPRFSANYEADTVRVPTLAPSR